MEPWRDELYHYGIKGMKWKKRKKGMSDLERAGRTYETNWRQYLSSQNASEDAGRNEGSDPRSKKASRAFRGGSYNLGKYRAKVAKKIQGGKQESGNSPYSVTRWSGTGKGKERAEKKTHRKVKAYDRKWKAKNAIKSFFKKR